MLIVLVDALGWRLAAARPGLLSLLPQRREIATMLGFSSGALPTLFTGRMPVEHGRFLMYQRARGDTPFSGFGRLRWLPQHIRGSWRMKRLLTRLVAARGVRGYFDLYDVPRERLESFDLAERDDIFAPGGLPGDSLWDTLERSGLRWHGWNWRTPQSQAFAEALGRIADGSLDVGFVYTAELDAWLHREGTRGAGVAACLTAVDGFVRAASEQCTRLGRPLWCHVLSDHGMVDVDSHVDLTDRLRRAPCRVWRDYEVFLDSTFARFWWHSPAAREAIRAELAGESRGRWLDRDTLERHGVWFEDHRYGDDLWLLEPGAILLPSYMGAQPVAAMHGYDPDHPDMTAFYASNRPLPGSLTRLRDVRGFLEQECADLIAEGIA